MSNKNNQKIIDQIWYALCYAPDEQAKLMEYAKDTVYPQIAKLMLKDRKEIKAQAIAKYKVELTERIYRLGDTSGNTYITINKVIALINEEEK